MTNKPEPRPGAAPAAEDRPRTPVPRGPAPPPPPPPFPSPHLVPPPLPPAPLTDSTAMAAPAVTAHAREGLPADPRRHRSQGGAPSRRSRAARGEKRAPRHRFLGRSAESSMLPWGRGRAAAGAGGTGCREGVVCRGEGLHCSRPQASPAAKGRDGLQNNLACLQGAHCIYWHTTRHPNKTRCCCGKADFSFEPNCLVSVSSSAQVSIANFVGGRCMCRRCKYSCSVRCFPKLLASCCAPAFKLFSTPGRAGSFLRSETAFYMGAESLDHQVSPLRSQRL